jgi:murein L,D-transpeptidase YcbB/YkuD
MNRLTSYLLASVLTLGAPAMAQEIVTINGVEATRVVIAPAQTDLARTIKSGLSTAYYGAPRDTAAQAEAQKLYYFYGARGFEPLWLSEGAAGQVAFSPAADKIIALFKVADLEGLRPSDYLTPAIDLGAVDQTPEAMAALETEFSAAALRYAQHIHSGRIKPSTVSGYFDIPARLIDEAAVLVQLASADDPSTVFASLEPQYREFAALKAALGEFYDGTVEQSIAVPDGRTLKPGMSDARVPVLRQRLELTMPATGADIYDDEVVAAVTSFQESLGLTADGIAGPATIAALNGGAATTKEDILANMERWRWMPEDMGDFHVMVNIPEFRLFIENGTPRDGYTTAYTTRVVTGTPKNQTPIFSDEIEHIVVNPYWNVPDSIATNEIGPKLASNPGYLASQNMELLYGGELINASAVDWSQTSVTNFRIRQRPGAGNALGTVKFLFPNSHDVYLHDTPSKSLFGRSFRAYSHGCVRVENPMDFADALLIHDPNLNAAKLESLYGPAERWVNTAEHIPVHLTYFTLRVDEDGTIRAYGDVYGHNKKLIEMMGL